MEIEHWADDAGKGIDDVLVGGGKIEIEKGESVEDMIRRAFGEKDNRPVRDEIANLSRGEGEKLKDIVHRLCKHGVLIRVAVAPPKERDELVGILRTKLALSDAEVEELRDFLGVFSVGVEELTSRGERNEKESVAKRLIKIGQEARLIHTEENEAFAIIALEKHRRVLSLRSRDFQLWLSRELWNREEEAAQDTAIKTAIGVLTAKAIFEGDQCEVHLRAYREGANSCWYDLADPPWRAVHITNDGWNVVDVPAVLFQRFKKTKAQVEPTKGGSINALWKFLRVKTERDKRLVVAWLVAALIPGSPRPVLVVGGEHGTSKTTMCRILRRLIDPCITELITPPDSVREFAQSAKHGFLLAFDNISDLPGWLSDALCRTATGDAFEKRALFTDEDDILWRYRRPIVLNGIGTIVTRPDLLDRSLLVNLEVLDPKERRPEEELWAEFDAQAPAMLGALLDLVVQVLKLLPSTPAPTKFRMADFARVGCAVERALNWEEGTFVAAMAENAEVQVEEAIDSSPVAQALLAFIAERREWRGSASGLLQAVRTGWNAESGGALPKSPNSFSQHLRRLAPPLRQHGVDIRFSRTTDGKRARVITIGFPKTSSEPSGSSGTRAPARGSDSNGAPQPPTDQSDGTLGHAARVQDTEPDPTMPALSGTSSDHRPGSVEESDA